MHWPETQESVGVQSFPSLQAVPESFSFWHPISTSQLSRVQMFWSLQLMVWVLAHWPLALQVPAVVQALPSSQDVPTAGRLAQPPCAVQLSVVHGFLSSQFLVLPAHLPPLHASFSVQPSLSSQLLPSFLAFSPHLPVAASHSCSEHLLPVGEQQHSPILQRECALAESVHEVRYGT